MQEIAWNMNLMERASEVKAKDEDRQVTPLCDMMAWVHMGEGRRPDVKQSEGHQQESDRWSENQRHEVATKEAAKRGLCLWIKDFYLIRGHSNGPIKSWRNTYREQHQI